MALAGDEVVGSMLDISGGNDVADGQVCLGLAHQYPVHDDIAALGDSRGGKFMFGFHIIQQGIGLSLVVHHLTGF
jgi:hypothetical protein